MTDSEKTPQAAPARSPDAGRSPLWVRLLLAASLAANFLVVGIVVGALIGRGHGDAHLRPPRDLASAIYLRALPAGHRAALEDELARNRPEREDRRAAIAAELAATLDAIRANPFEPARLAERIAHQRGAVAERSRLGDRLFVARIGAMSAAERQAYADALEQMLRRIARGRGD